MADSTESSQKTAVAGNAARHSRVMWLDDVTVLVDSGHDDISVSLGERCCDAESWFVGGSHIL